MTRKKASQLYIVHRGLSWKNKRIEPSDKPVDLSGWPKAAIKRFVDRGIVTPAKGTADD